MLPSHTSVPGRQVEVQDIQESADWCLFESAAGSYTLDAPPLVVTWHKNAIMSWFVLDFGAFNINRALATQSRVRVGCRLADIAVTANTGQIANAFAKLGEHHASTLIETFNEPLIQTLPQLSGTFCSAGRRKELPQHLQHQSCTSWRSCRGARVHGRRGVQLWGRTGRANESLELARLGKRAANCNAEEQAQWCQCGALL